MVVEKLNKKKFEQLEIKLTIKTLHELGSALDALECANDEGENGLKGLFELLSSEFKTYR